MSTKELIDELVESRMELANERRYIQEQHVSAWGKIIDALGHNRGIDDSKSLCDEVIDVIKERYALKSEVERLALACRVHHDDNGELKAQLAELQAQVRTLREAASALVQRMNSLAQMSSCNYRFPDARDRAALERAEQALAATETKETQ